MLTIAIVVIVGVVLFVGYSYWKSPAKVAADIAKADAVVKAAVDEAKK